MKKQELDIRKQISFHRESLKSYQRVLKRYLQKEYEIRREKCLEVESDRKDLERARKALERLREAYKDD